MTILDQLAEYARERVAEAKKKIPPQSKQENTNYLHNKTSANFIPPS